MTRREFDNVLADLCIAIEAGAEAHHNGDDEAAEAWRAREDTLRLRIDVALDGLYARAKR